MSPIEESPAKPKRKRSLTEVSLKWLADRVKRAEEIKQKLERGEYSINSDRVAASLLNRPDNE